MNIHWTLFTNCTKEINAQRLMNRVVKNLDLDIDNLVIAPYHKGGFTCRFTTEIDGSDWEKVPYIIILQAQMIGRGWIIFLTEFEFSIWSSDSSISGVEHISVDIDRYEKYRDKEGRVKFPLVKL